MAKEQARVTLIKRTTPFCGACQIQQAQLDGAGLKYDVIDITEQPEAVEQYGITSVPIVLIEKDNGEVERFDGFRPVEVLKEHL